MAAPPMAGKALTFAEFCRQYLPEQKIAPWQEDILPKIQAARLTAKVKIPACLLEDSMIDFRDRLSADFGRDLAERVDRECWATFTVPESHTKLNIESLKAVMDSLPKYNRGFIAINDVRAFEGLNPIPSDSHNSIVGFPVRVIPGIEGFWACAHRGATA
jgi:hypothetical protein